MILSFPKELFFSCFSVSFFSLSTIIKSKRVKESNKKCQELMKRLFSKKYVKYKKLESFFQDEGSVRKNTSHICFNAQAVCSKYTWYY